MQIYGNQHVFSKLCRCAAQPVKIRQKASKSGQAEGGPSYLCGMQFVLYAILAWVLFNFIFKLVLPVYNASRRFKKGFKEMHGRMQEQMRQQQQGFQTQTSSATGAGTNKQDPKKKLGDYIDFEEVK